MMCIFWLQAFLLFFKKNAFFSGGGYPFPLQTFISHLIHTSTSPNSCFFLHSTNSSGPNLFLRFLFFIIFAFTLKSICYRHFLPWSFFCKRTLFSHFFNIIKHISSTPIHVPLPSPLCNFQLLYNTNVPGGLLIYKNHVDLPFVKYEYMKTGAMYYIRRIFILT